MNTTSLPEPLLLTLPYNSWRRRCFLFRYSLDQSSSLMLTCQIVLGCILTVHPLLSFAILTVNPIIDLWQLRSIWNIFDSSYLFMQRSYHFNFYYSDCFFYRNSYKQTGRLASRIRPFLIKRHLCKLFGLNFIDFIYYLYRYYYRRPYLSFDLCHYLSFNLIVFVVYNQTCFN